MDFLIRELVALEAYWMNFGAVLLPDCLFSRDDELGVFLVKPLRQLLAGISSAVESRRSHHPSHSVLHSPLSITPIFILHSHTQVLS